MVFVCWLFTGHGFNRDKVMRYGPQHVATLARMLSRHGSHELLCVTDQPKEVQAAGVGVIPMPPEVSALPRYYPKVWLFSDELAGIIGRRFGSIDLDAVVTGDLGPVLDTNDDFIIWDQAKGEPYNTSLLAMEPGARPEVWDRFTVEAGDAAQIAVGRPTGDQCWLGHFLGPDEATFSEDTGVLQYRPSKHRASKPEGVRAAFMCGPYLPDVEAKSSEWVREAYR